MPHLIIFMYYHKTVKHINSNESICVGDLEFAKEAISDFNALTDKNVLKHKILVVFLVKGPHTFKCTVSDAFMYLWAFTAA